MTQLVLQFETAPTGMEFSCGGQEVIARQRQAAVSAGSPAKEPKVPIQELIGGILQQHASIERRLSAILPEVQSIAVEFIEQFVSQLLEADQSLIRERLVGVLNTALSQVEIQDTTKLFVHPEFLSTVKEAFEGPEYSSFEVLQDRLLQPADCRVEGPEHEWIARLQHQLENARQKTIRELNE